MLYELNTSEAISYAWAQLYTVLTKRVACDMRRDAVWRQFNNREAAGRLRDGALPDRGTSTGAGGGSWNSYATASSSNLVGR